MTDRRQAARDLLYQLADACEQAMARSPHATPALIRERNGYLLAATRLAQGDDPEQIRHAEAGRARLVKRLDALQGPVTW